MGHGIAQVAAQSGFQIVAVETKKEALDAGMGRYVANSSFIE
jgi:3-hydroxyacyl-CoA dehydrogenase